MQRNSRRKRTEPDASSMVLGRLEGERGRRGEMSEYFLAACHIVYTYTVDIRFM